jgi:hypothetical protein
MVENDLAARDGIGELREALALLFDEEGAAVAGLFVLDHLHGVFILQGSRCRQAGLRP